MWAASVTRAIHALTEDQRLRLQDILLIASVIATCGAMCVGVLRWLWTRWGRPQLTAIIRAEVGNGTEDRERRWAELLAAHTAELRPNGGASMKDRVDALVERMNRMEGS